jgi:hypothetical protein
MEGAYALRQRLSTSASNPTVCPLIVSRSCAEMEWCRTEETGTVIGATMSFRVYSLFTDRRVFELTVRRGAGGDGDGCPLGIRSESRLKD